jgi:hypothetical protein
VAGTDVEEDFEELVKGTPGGPNNPHGRAEKPGSEINCNYIIRDSPDESYGSGLQEPLGSPGIAVRHPSTTSPRVSRREGG